MSLIICPECGNQVSTLANSCPNCGYPISAQPVKTKISIYRNTGAFVAAVRKARIFRCDTGEEIMSLRPFDRKEITLDVERPVSIYCSIAGAKSEPAEIKPNAVNEFEIKMAWGLLVHGQVILSRLKPT